MVYDNVEYSLNEELLQSLIANKITCEEKLHEVYFTKEQNGSTCFICNYQHSSVADIGLIPYESNGTI